MSRIWLPQPVRGGGAGQPPSRMGQRGVRDTYHTSRHLQTLCTPAATCCRPHARTPTRLAPEKSRSFALLLASPPSCPCLAASLSHAAPRGRCLFLSLFVSRARCQRAARHPRARAATPTLRLLCVFFASFAPGLRCLYQHPMPHWRAQRSPFQTGILPAGEPARPHSAGDLREGQPASPSPWWRVTTAFGCQQPKTSRKSRG